MVDHSQNNHDCCDHHSAHHELEIKGLCVSYKGLMALDHVSLATSCGNRLALVGPNGAGKSTLLKAIAGLVKRSCGTIHWRGTSVKKWSREFAYLPQREEIDWNFPVTVRGLAEMGRYPHTGMFKKFSKADAEVVDNAIESLELENLQHKQIRELSGGQQQRAFLARAISQEAHVLLLDEPFTGLDPNASELLSKLIHKLSSQGRLIMASHHDMNTVKDIFNQTLMIKQQVVNFGDTAELVNPQKIKELFST